MTRGVRPPLIQGGQTPLGSQRVHLRFEPDGADVRVPSGTAIFDAASWNGVAIDSTCGGHGTCKKCKVRIDEGDVAVSAVDPRAFSPDELREGWRLACRAPAVEDLVVHVPPLQTRPKAALVGVGRHVILRPAVQKRHLVLDEPSLEDQRSDVQRVLDGLDDLEPRVDLPVVRTLGKVLREAMFDVTAVVCDDVLIGIEPGDTTARRYAIAFDLGTTTVVATLLDLETGTPAAVASMLNRQQPYGADVISRVSATMLDDGALGALEARAHETLAQLAGEVCEEAGVAPTDVYEIVVVGNVTMTQLALGIDPEPLSMAPFIVAAHDLPPALAADFGVTVHPRAPAVVFPSLGAYVGADIVAGMLASGLTRDSRLRLFIDVGTNSEIALGSSERVLATAAPAGPAFEAAQIRCGMRAAEGAIEGVRIRDDGELELEVIGDVEPVGICGSGLVDCVAEMVQAGLLDHSGRFTDDPRMTKIGEERVFMLADDVYLSQRDVRELQFAKASIATGWNILLREMGLDARRHLAGAARRLVRRVPVARQRGADRARAAAGAAADRLCRQRGQRGRQDGGTERPRASRGALDRARGRVRRALRARGLQRRVHRPAGVPRMKIVACGALAVHVQAVARRRGLDVEVVPLPALLHNRPERIAPAVKAALEDSDVVAVAYADCGTYGALDDVLGDIPRLAGDHCYDVLARDEVRAALEDEPGTYLLTDFLARTFEHTVLRELGLDRHPELRDAYFGHYTRVLWLAQHPTPATRAAAERAAAHLGLPLEVREVGEEALERQLADLLATSAPRSA